MDPADIAVLLLIAMMGFLAYWTFHEANINKPNDKNGSDEETIRQDF